MPQFTWKGIKNGTYKEGVIEAKNEHEATYLVRKNHVIIYSVKSLEKQKNGKNIFAGLLPNEESQKNIKEKDVLVFTKKLTTMVRAGLPVVDTLALLADQIESKAFKKVLKQIHLDIESGNSVSVSFSKYDKLFGNIYINLVKAGEASGKLDTFLAKLVENLEKTAKIKANIKSALFYPVILLVVSLAVISIMLIYVVPIFVELFASVGGELPALTQMIMSASDYVRDPMRGGVTFVAIAVGLYMLKKQIQTNYNWRKKYHRMLLKLPLVGDLIIKSGLSKIGMILGNLSAAGVPLIEALEISTTSTDNIPLTEAMNNVKLGVFSGSPLSELFDKEEVIPSTFSQMIKVGEETGNMEEMFESISGYYQEELDNAVQRLTAMLEPIMIVFMGGTIGFIIIAMYLPIFQMGQMVG
ncbi:type II secretion system F family protein [Candidatus Thioglobus autotrophicus]|jgi:type IV pilus assembly protein PilC|uniref:type II secretion system F family protein n=1 Tax=Candidatus Thioglobus autotrophicus TaxID=1705394 RepID=UPI00299D9E9A|nr:type II secretion system F family protein [Candidatus Thioglobus autotrophicus]WPE16020.1 type II secretion system F family protein [Candidatus Thioglobus autotrophicus]